MIAIQYIIKSTSAIQYINKSMIVCNF